MSIWLSASRRLASTSPAGTISLVDVSTIEATSPAAASRPLVAAISAPPNWGTLARSNSPSTPRNPTPSKPYALARETISSNDQSGHPRVEKLSFTASPAAIAEARHGPPEFVRFEFSRLVKTQHRHAKPDRKRQPPGDRNQFPPVLRQDQPRLGERADQYFEHAPINLDRPRHAIAAPPRYRRGPSRTRPWRSGFPPAPPTTSLRAGPAFRRRRKG